MPKEIIAVYQDCVLCGDKGRQKMVELAKKGLNIRKVSFTTEEGRELCHKAVFSHGIESMPFYTDGTIFSISLDSFLEKKPAKKVKKTKKVEKEAKDGLDSES